MTEHLGHSHTIIAYEKIAENSKEIEQIKTLNSQLADENKQLRENLMMESQQQKRLLQEFEQRLKQLEKVFQQGNRRVEADGYSGPIISNSRNASPCSSVFGEDSGCSSNSAKSVNKLRDDVEGQQSQLIRLNDNVQSLQENFTQVTIALDELRLRQDVLEVRTTNGIFIWKIPDIRRRYRDAVDRKTISLYSPPFYTSPNGYYMGVRVYLKALRSYIRAACYYF